MIEIQSGYTSSDRKRFIHNSYMEKYEQVKETAENIFVSYNFVLFAYHSFYFLSEIKVSDILLWS